MYVPLNVRVHTIIYPYYTRHLDRSLTLFDGSELSCKIYFYVEKSQKKKKVSQSSQKGAIIVVGELPDRDSSSREPEKSDNTSTSKQPELDFSESFSDSSEEEILIPDNIPTSRTPSPVPKPPHLLISADIPTLETTSPVTKPAHHGALSIPSCDPDWYDSNPYETQPDTQKMAEGKGEAGDKISQSGKLYLMIVHVCIV